MPGPVSDSYDPEFGTGENAEFVRTAIQSVQRVVCDGLPEERRNIVEVAREGPKASKRLVVRLTENERRILRFALDRALESL